jgi:hypothetical protein
MNRNARRIARLEARYPAVVAADPQSVAVYQMLVSGEWRLALESLERPDERILHQWRRAKERGAYPQLDTNGEPKDWSLMRARLQPAMADVAVETKSRIARLLLAADDDHTLLRHKAWLPISRRNTLSCANRSTEESEQKRHCSETFSRHEGRSSGLYERRGAPGCSPPIMSRRIRSKSIEQW